MRASAGQAHFSPSSHSHLEPDSSAVHGMGVNSVPWWEPSQNGCSRETGQGRGGRGRAWERAASAQSERNAAAAVPTIRTCEGKGIPIHNAGRARRYTVARKPASWSGRRCTSSMSCQPRPRRHRASFSRRSPAHSPTHRTILLSEYQQAPWARQRRLVGHEPLFGARAAPAPAPEACARPHGRGAAQAARFCRTAFARHTLSQSSISGSRCEGSPAPPLLSGVWAAGCAVLAVPAAPSSGVGVATAAGLLFEQPMVILRRGPTSVTKFNRRRTTFGQNRDLGDLSTQYYYGLPKNQNATAAFNLTCRESFN